jgi:DNA-directed RNA polymerase subunit RPC12/RpoP
MSDDHDWGPGKPLATRRFDMGNCLNCGAMLTGLTGPLDEPEPQSSLMVCAYCGHIMEWGGKGKGFLELSDEAIRDAAGDPDILEAQELVRQFRAAQGPFGATCAACQAPNDVGRIRCRNCGKPLVFPNA